MLNLEQQIRRVAGIDVSAKQNHLVIRIDGKQGKGGQFDNTAKGHNQVIRALQKAHVTQVCLEATGLYHLDLAVAIDKADIPVMVVNPKASKNFFEVMQGRSKTDALDAGLLAEFAERMPFERWQRPDDRALAIRATSRHINLNPAVDRSIFS